MQETSSQTLKRLPLYLNYVKSTLNSPPDTISAASIALALGKSHIQVRKDLATVSSSGRPKIGYVKTVLVAELERYLGYDSPSSAVLVGAGRLGCALYEYQGFTDYGLNLVAAFDIDAERAQKETQKPVFPLKKLPDLCKRLGAQIGVITVPAQHAQQACDALVQAGVRAIWNFAPTHLSVPPGILVQNEDMASSLALLSKHISKNIQGGQYDEQQA